MQITRELLIKAVPNVERNIRSNKNFKGYTIDAIVELLNKYAKEFGIDTKMRWAHYLAQVGHESMSFLYSEEIASGSAYENRKDLGNVVPGDGKKYKGRGLIQLTGRANYRNYSGYCGFDVVAQPELLAKPVGAIRSSMWFWKTHNLNYYADIDATTLISKVINGGSNGLSDRMIRTTTAKKAFGLCR